MAVPDRKTYNLRVFALMLVYTLLIFVLFPYAKHAQSLPLKVVLALVPTVPVIGVIWLMAAQVVRSDEFQQRLHLLALSVSTGAVAATSLVAGFLCAVHVIDLGGDSLIWVMPSLCMFYGLSRIVLARWYGGSGCE